MFRLYYSIILLFKKTEEYRAYGSRIFMRPQKEWGDILAPLIRGHEAIKIIANKCSWWAQHLFQQLKLLFGLWWTMLIQKTRQKNNLG